MVGVLVYVDHDDGAFNPNSLGVLVKAASLGVPVTAFVAGSGCAPACTCRVSKPQSAMAAHPFCRNTARLSEATTASRETQL